MFCFVSNAENNFTKNFIHYLAMQPSTPQRQPRLIHTSKKKVIVETKGGRTSTKTKTIVTSNVVQKSIREIADNAGTRRSSRVPKPSTNRKLESMSSPSRPITNGTPRSNRSTASPQSASSTKLDLLAELSKKSSNFSPDVVSDLEEILGSPIKTREIHNDQTSRIHSKSNNLNAKGSGMVRVNYKSQTDNEIKPTTRTSKRLSNRIQITPQTSETVTKVPKSSTATKSNRKQIPVDPQMSSEESHDEPYNNLQRVNTPTHIVMNIKQEKEVSYTMTDENSGFTCEMCSAVFSDRTQLLDHVPIHI